ncbi:MAG: aminotransferase class I/II-fold pyridoxal phosphate-dependent enzyme [Bacteroidales bacterium]|jgi:choline kinase/histidinol-phosphate/aromatic aminotransferase/cobyric acid decarboxylase-like protein|nr:aminotransferase class I/II-fold pyridoxal phosphate-dependent enzyme [Bacteroidales bacterium]
MQAVILAAGMGKRLGEYTKNNTKCMVEVNGEKLIDRVIKQLGGLNLKRLVLVVGYQGDKLKNYIGDRYDDVIKIEYIENPVYDKTNNIYSLALAKNVLCEDDTLLLESDIIFEDRVLQTIVENPYPNLALVDKYETWMDGTMVCINDKNEIVNFVPKAAFRYEDVDSYYKTVNVYKFSKEFSRDVYVPFLDAYSKVMGNNEYYEQVLRVITYLHKSELRALPLSGEKWYEIDDAQDLDIASTLFSNDKAKYNEYRKRIGGYWRFPQLTDFSVSSNPYFPTKRMLDEMRANFDTLVGAHPSGMQVNALVAGKNMGVREGYVAVANGDAEVWDVLQRVLFKGKKLDFVLEDLRKDSANPDFRFNADDVIRYFSDKAAAVLVNPDTFSGNCMKNSDVLKVADWCGANGKLLIVDESDVDFSDDGESLMSNDVLEKYEKSLMVIKSISKSCGLPGLRISVVASGNAAVISEIRQRICQWNINSVAEFALQIFSKYESDYKDSCLKFKKERKRFVKALQSFGFFRVIPSQSGAVLCELTNGQSTEQFCQILIERNVMASGEGKFVSLAVRSREDNDKLLKVLSVL